MLGQQQQQQQNQQQQGVLNPAVPVEAPCITHGIAQQLLQGRSGLPPSCAPGCLLLTAPCTASGACAAS